MKIGTIKKLEIGDAVVSMVRNHSYEQPFEVALISGGRISNKRSFATRRDANKWFNHLGKEVS